MRFAIKCGGSAKKIQLSNTEAITIKKSPKQKDNNEVAASKRLLKNTDCKKCDDIIRNEMLDNVNADNAIVCKHDSTSNLSILNPGLLIIEKETVVDPQVALLNAHVLPHSHLNMTHQQAKNLYYNHSQSKSASKKTPRPIGFERLNQNIEMSNADYFNKVSNRDTANDQQLQFYLQQQQRHEQKLHMKQHHHKNKKHHSHPHQYKMYKTEAQTAHNSFPVENGEFLNVYDDESNEHQLNFDRYLSKSKVSNQSTNRF